MKHLKKYNESQVGKLYLIEEDHGDSASFKGMYDNLDSFITDIKVELIKNKDEFGYRNMKLEDLEHEVTEDNTNMINRGTIRVNHGHSEWLYYYMDAELNKIYS